MMRYETLFLTIPELTNDEFSEIGAALDKLIKAEDGVMLSCERWGKYKLAYPVNKRDYGIYGLIRFETEASDKKKLLDSIKIFFSLKYNDKVIRFMTAVLDIDASLAYQRPESLEEAPDRHSDGFLKEKRIKGFFSPSGKRGQRPEPSKAEPASVSEAPNSTAKETAAEKKVADAVVEPVPVAEASVDENVSEEKEVPTPGAEAGKE